MISYNQSTKVYSIVNVYSLDLHCTKKLNKFGFFGVNLRFLVAFEIILV